MPVASRGIATSRRAGAARRRRAGAVVALVASLALGPAAADTKAFENPQYRYSVALPAGCRHEEGPGTLDAVCSTELDPEKSARGQRRPALVLEVGAETVADRCRQDAGRAGAALRRGAVQAELPEAVCGETDRARVKIDNAKQVLEEARVVYTADVTCPEIKFLGLGERRAIGALLITPGLRYRLMARALKEDFEKRKEAIDAFFASFRHTCPSGENDEAPMKACRRRLPRLQLRSRHQGRAGEVTGGPVQHGLARRRDGARHAT